jgi:outer membrane protein OmpA-like peptidoglycan-associated protein
MFALRILLSISWALLALVGNAQLTMVQLADRERINMAYANAIQQYTQAFELGEDDPAAMRHLAECYRSVRDLPNAAVWYKRLLSSGKAQPQDLFDLVRALRFEGKYAESDQWMEDLAGLIKEDEGYAQHGTLAAVKKLMEKPAFPCTVMPMEANGPYAEIAPVLDGGRLLFSSARRSTVSMSDVHTWDNTPFLDMFSAPLDKQGVCGEASVFAPSLNTRWHESDPQVSREHHELYFTRNSFEDGHVRQSANGVSNLKIYIADSTANGWAGERPFAYNNDEYSVGHPSLSDNGKRLYFASDMPGGYGGADIYVCKRQKDGSWGEPKNLGPTVNTKSNELYPTIFRNDVLFFTSDGHWGLGGQDIFLVEHLLSRPKPAVNVGAPVNSRSDDYALDMLKDGTLGFFTSNRNGDVGNSDIYRFNNAHPYEKTTLISGTVSDSFTDEPLERVPVRVFNLQRQEIARTLTRADGHFELEVPPQDILVVVGAEGPTVELPMMEQELESGEPAPLDVSLPFQVAMILDTKLSSAITKRPIAGARIIITDRRNPNAEPFVAVSPADGTNHISLPPEYRTLAPFCDVFITHDDYSTLQFPLTAQEGDVFELEMQPLSGHEPQLNLEVVVTEVGTGAVVPHADVVIADVRNGKTHLVRGVSDANGIAHIVLPNDQWSNAAYYTAHVSRVGYVPQTSSLSNAKNGRLTISLEPMEPWTDLAAKLDYPTVYFAYDSASLRSDAQDILEEAIVIMHLYPNIQVELLAGTDSRASFAYNQTLSRARAANTRTYMEERAVDKGRIKSVSVGEQWASNLCPDGVECSEEQHQKNRRVEFVVSYKPMREAPEANNVANAGR